MQLTLSLTEAIGLLRQNAGTGALGLPCRASGLARRTISITAPASCKRSWSVRKIRLLQTEGASDTGEFMENPALRLVTSTIEKQTVMARRRPNAEYRTREYLSEHEVELLIEATKGNRQGHRDGTMILVAFQHGLRAAELCHLRWEQIEGMSAMHGENLFSQRFGGALHSKRSQI
jgi:integrase